MRYSIVGAMVETVRQAGGTDIREAKHSGIVFATLDDSGVNRLTAMGCTVTPVGKVTTDVMLPEIMPPQPVTAEPVFTPSMLLALTGFDAFREYFDPPLLGEGINVAVIDTGIRETHELINGGVVYRKNFTSDPMADDFDHGTGVAALVRAMAPKCGLLNIKILDSKGEGTEEELTLAIDDLLDYHSQSGALHVINLSLGSPDDGDPYNPVRVACRSAIELGIYVRAAAGNTGPLSGTVMSPAVEKSVGAIGSCGFDTANQRVYISAFSGRGPTLEGLIKPDYVMFGENIITASSASDTATVAKSGTSFACPQASGLNAISLEAYARQASSMMEQYPHLAESIEWSYQQAINPATSLEAYIPKVTAKPQGVSAGKDNDYGWGMPFASLALDAFQGDGQPPAAMNGITEMVIPVMGIGLLGMVMSTMAKALK